MRSKPPNVPPTPLRYLKSSKKKEGFDFRYFTVMASLTVLPLCMLLGPGVYDWWQFYKQDDGIEYD
ncbi:hypothetical protein GGI26_001351 [Coemansia sp. RSA 1358]|nr:hypothetical protein GGI26_001351 [Coemansia sp. RSA 1358]